MNKACENIQRALALSRIAEDCFEGLDDGFVLPNPYGGRLLGQAVSAAGQTLDNERALHSLHAYFMRTGKSELPIQYHVQHLRDGGNFSSRRVEAMQQDKLLFSCICGFHTFESNADHQLAQMPDVAGPESIAANTPWPEVALYEQYAKANPAHPIRAFDLRFVRDHNTVTSNLHAGKRQLWIKYLGTTHAPRDAEALLSWFSDFFLLLTALKALGVPLASPELRIASLDHALWIHRPLDIQQWLLLDYSCTTLSHSRAHTEAKIYNTSGSLLASLAQEGLLQLQGSKA